MSSIADHRTVDGRTYSNVFFPGSTKCLLRCNALKALALRYHGAEENSAVLYRCRISGDLHFSHQIWSPLTLYLLLLHSKIRNPIYDKRPVLKRRYRVRGDQIWYEKWKPPEILNRYSNADFSSTPPDRNARALRNLVLHLSGHQAGVSHTLS